MKLLAPPSLLRAILLFFSYTSVAFSDGNDPENHAIPRPLIALAARPTNPLDPKISRKRFPETDGPQVCLAFLSCCGRTDLLNHTLSAAIRHMEKDEPDGFRYEIAWVDNGSGLENTQAIAESYQVDHSLSLEQNMGLAYGLNLLIYNLCTAPYILLMEEDWLYLDEAVAPQTAARKRAISTAVALTETKLIADDGREVMGVFLRRDAISPNLHAWQEKNIDLNTVLATQGNSSPNDIPVEYQISCGEKSLEKMNNVWGSFTNGVGLYKRDALMDIGRMYGEPDDIFNSQYTEANYAYRAAQKYCHTAIQFSEGPLHDTAVFKHIGGGRGTVPMQKKKGSVCEGEYWMFYGTPQYEIYRSHLIDSGAQVCSDDEAKLLYGLETIQQDAKSCHEETTNMNKEVFEEEAKERELMRTQARQIRETNNNILRESLVDLFGALSDKEILEYADQLEGIADSPHQIQGFWDSHGRIIKK